MGILVLFEICVQYTFFCPTWSMILQGIFESGEKIDLEPITMVTPSVAGSVFILKTNFMPGASGKGGNGRMVLRESVHEGTCRRGRNQGQ